MQWSLYSHNLFSSYSLIFSRPSHYASLLTVQSTLLMYNTRLIYIRTPLSFNHIVLTINNMSHTSYYSDVIQLYNEKVIFFAKL